MSRIMRFETRDSSQNLKPCIEYLEGSEQTILETLVPYLAREVRSLSIIIVISVSESSCTVLYSNVQTFEKINYEQS